MKRRIAHLSFGMIALGCAVLAAYQGIRLYRAHEVNAAIEAATASSLMSEVPEARFARAAELARRGEIDAAVSLYKELSRGERAGLRSAAAYNLGNLYMRQALGARAGDLFVVLPLIELAKESYRDVLRSDPQHWDARYNLERALWLAPELEETVVDSIRPDREERVMSTLQGTRSDLP